MDNKKTLVLGGSPKPERFSNKAIIKLRSFNHEVISIGQKQAMVGDVVIETSMINFDNIHTITIYLGPNNQVEYYDAKRWVYNKNYNFIKFFWSTIAIYHHRPIRLFIKHLLKILIKGK